MSLVRCALVALLLSLAVPDAQGQPAAQAQPHGPVPAAPVLYSCTFFYQLLAYTGMPDLRKFGIMPARVFGPQDLWDKGDNREKVPSVQHVARGLARRPPNDGPIVLDIEHWPYRGSEAEVAGTVDRLLGVLAHVRELEPNANVGYYGIPPVRDYFRAIRGPGDPQYVEWQRDNDRFQRLADSTTLLFPSLYTLYDDVEAWRRYAIANLEEARRLAGSRRVYAFLWPQFHGSNKQLALQYVSGAYWRAQLEVVAAHADGAVLWGGWDADGRAQWDESAPWWLETKRFIEARDAGPCRR